MYFLQLATDTADDTGAWFVEQRPGGATSTLPSDGSTTPLISAVDRRRGAHRPDEDTLARLLGLP
jgi:hypothetical protein